jgi:hypothetical protein
MLNRKVSRKQVLYITDEGALHIICDGSSISDKTASESAISSSMLATLDIDKSTPLYVLFDNSEQGFKKVQVPPVSSSHLTTLLDSQAKTEFGSGHYTGYLQLPGWNKEKGGGYLFTAVNNSGRNGEILAKLHELPNQIAGVYSSPIEMAPLLEKLSDGDGGWQALITQIKSNSIRISIYENGYLVLTRLANLEDSDKPGSIASEVIKTVEYTNRLGFKEGDKVSIVSILSAELDEKVSFEMPQVSANLSYTSQEAADKLGVSHLIPADQMYADLILATYFAMKPKPAMPLYTEMLRESNKNDSILKIAKTALMILCGFFLLTAGLNVAKIASEKSKLEKAATEKKKAEKQAASQAAGIKDYPDEYKTATIEMIALNDHRPLPAMLPLDNIEKLKSVDFSNKYISDMDVRVNDDGSYITRITVMFIRPDYKNVAGVLEQVDSFVNSIKNQFAITEYEIQTDNFKEQLLGKNLADASSQNENMPVILNIIGPKKTQEGEVQDGQ